MSQVFSVWLPIRWLSPKLAHPSHRFPSCSRNWQRSRDGAVPSCTAWALWLSDPACPAGWGSVVWRGAASGALSQGKGEQGCPLWPRVTHYYGLAATAVVSWPECGWKLLGSSIAFSCLNPSGWQRQAVIPDASVRQMPVKPGIFHQGQHFYECHQPLMS